MSQMLQEPAELTLQLDYPSVYGRAYYLKID